MGQQGRITDGCTIPIAETTGGLQESNRQALDAEDSQSRQRRDSGSDKREASKGPQEHGLSLPPSAWSASSAQIVVRLQESPRSEYDCLDPPLPPPPETPAVSRPSR